MKVFQLVCSLKVNEKQKLLIENSAAYHNQVTANLAMPLFFACKIFVHRQNVSLNSLLSEREHRTKPVPHYHTHVITHQAFPKHLFAFLCKPASQLAWAACTVQSSPNTEKVAVEKCLSNPC